MKNQKTYSDMKDHLTTYETSMLDFRINQWIQRNKLLSNEIEAYRTLLDISEDRNDVFTTKVQEEIQRRRVFLNELMQDF